MTIPLISFSGGLDSTALLYLRLSEGNDVDTFYVIAGQHSDKVKRELYARENILKWLRRKFKDRTIQDKIVNIEATVKFEISDRGHKTGNWPDSTFTQPLSWLYGAQFALNGDFHRSLEMAYVAEDQMTYYGERLKNVWEMLSPICKQKYVPLEIPFWHTTKAELLKIVPSSLLKLTWTCENPKTINNSGLVTAIRPCKACTPCIRQSTELHILASSIKRVRKIPKIKDTSLKQLIKGD